MRETVEMRETGTLTLKIGKDDKTIAFGAEGEQIGERYVVVGYCHVACSGWLKRQIPGSFKKDSGETLVADFRLVTEGLRQEYFALGTGEIRRLEFETVGAVTLIPKPSSLTPEQRDEVRREWEELSKHDTPMPTIEKLSPRLVISIDRSKGVPIEVVPDEKHGHKVNFPHGLPAGLTLMGEPKVVMMDHGGYNVSLTFMEISPGQEDPQPDAIVE